MYQLPLLSYDYNELEPFMDAQTMEHLYNRSHRRYVDRLNAAVDDLSFVSYSLANIFHFASSFPDSIRDNAAGHYNYNLFWNILAPGEPQNPIGETARKIKQSFGSFEGFQRAFTQSSVFLPGRGWIWLVVTDNQELEITQTVNEVNPLMDMAAIQGTPILCLNIWEEIDELNLHNSRADYVDNFWHVVNWDKVEELYDQTLTMTKAR